MIRGGVIIKVLIIGGTRFIGLPVIRKLSEMGHQIVLFNRGVTESEVPKNAKRIFGDRINFPNFKEEFIKFSPDVVIDMFPYTELEAKCVVEVFKDLAPHIVVISSQDVYRAWGLVIGSESGEPEATPIYEYSNLRETRFPYRKEETQKHERNYNYDKILVERTILNHDNIQGTILRLPVVYGEKDKQHRLFQYVKRMYDNRPAIILEENFAHWKWSRSYVEDVAHAITLAATNPGSKGKIYNISPEETLSNIDFVRNIANIIGWKGEIFSLPREILSTYQGGMDVSSYQDMVVDSSLIRRELGFTEVVSFHEGLARTIKWELNNYPQDIKFDYDVEDQIFQRLK